MSAVGDGESGLQLVFDMDFDLVILDLMLPTMNGREICREIKKVVRTPVLVLTSRIRDTGALEGDGADDYLLKPIRVPELAARVGYILEDVRRPSIIGVQPAILQEGPLRLDLEQKLATLNGDPLELCPVEFRLLAYFMQNPGRLLSHEALLTRAWGPMYATEHQYLRLYVSRLRKKLSDDAACPTYITNVRGQGYRFRESSKEISARSER